MPTVLLQTEIAALMSRCESNGHSVVSSRQLEAILHSGTCICGTRFDDDGEPSKHILNLIDSIEDSGVFSQVNLEILKSLNAKALQSRGIFQAQWANLRREEQEITQLTQEIASFKTQNDSLLAAGSDGQRPDELLSLIANYRVAVDKLEESRQERDAKQAELDELQKKLRAEKVDADDPRLTLQNEVDFVENLIMHAESIHSKGMDDVRVKLSDTFESLFRKMIGSDGEAFSSIELDSNLNVRVLDDARQERQGGFSAGWALVAAFAFAYALNAIAGFELPLVVDTPFGNLSKERKRLLANTLSEATKESTFRGRQFILLVTDTEADHGVASALSGPHTEWISGQYNQLSQTIAFETRSQ